MVGGGCACTIRRIAASGGGRRMSHVEKALMRWIRLERLEKEAIKKPPLDFGFIPSCHFLGPVPLWRYHVKSLEVCL